MLTLLGTFIGFLTSLAPDALKMFQDGLDKKHEIELYKLQMKSNFQEAEAIIAAAEMKAIHQPDTYAPMTHSENINFFRAVIEFLRGTVRPVLTYMFFFLYAWVKFMMIQHVGLDNALDTPWLLWTEEDGAIFAAIISYWFGQRGMEKYREHRTNASITSRSL